MNQNAMLVGLATQGVRLAWGLLYAGPLWIMTIQECWPSWPKNVIRSLFALLRG